MMPVMGDSTPLTKSAVEYAERVLQTDSHRYGYMISHAQSLELAMQSLRDEISGKPSAAEKEQPKED